MITDLIFSESLMYIVIDTNRIKISKKMPVPFPKISFTGKEPPIVNWKSINKTNNMKIPLVMNSGDINRDTLSPPK